MKNIAIIGEKNKSTSYSQVNQQIFSILHELGYQVTSKIYNTDTNSTEIAIHHDPEEFFGNLIRPDVDKFIVYRTWDFGPFPKKWVEIINSQCDQLWVYSNWVMEQAISGGVIPKKIKVMPIGVKTPSINLENISFDIKTKKTFKFFFIGATIYRKGIDILLEAYKKAFSNNDDVTLIIKDNPKDVFYKDISYQKEIEDVIKEKNSPEIILINDYLSEEEILLIYDAVDIGVFPYRSEGFARPILELMAAGVPSIVPNFGPCLDYCSDAHSIIIPAQRIALPIHQSLEFNTLGFIEEIEEVEFCEVDPDILAKSLKEVFNNRSSLRKMSEKGKIFANQYFSRKKIMEIMENNINDLEN